jgi:hypothetical protein
MSYTEDLTPTSQSPDEEESNLGRWLLMGLLLTDLATNLNPDDWDGTTFAQFRRQLNSTYAPVIADWLRTEYIPWLEARGIPVGISASPASINRSIEAAFINTRDLHRSMQSSFTTGEFARWGGAKNQGAILKDMARIVGDNLATTTANRLEEAGLFTGRQRWRTVGPDSRHAELNQKISSTGWSFKGQRITGPRFNPQNPTDWSNCNCFVEYEWDAGGEQGWI